MSEPAPKLRPVREYDHYYNTSAIAFIDTARMFLPVVDDPDSLPNMPGYPISDMLFPYLFGYQFSICLRDDFFELFDWHGVENHPERSTMLEIEEDERFHLVLMGREWAGELFQVLTSRWDWLPIYGRYPLLFPDSLAELEAFYRHHELALYTPDDSEEAFDASCALVWPIEDYLIHRLHEIGWENARATLTKAEVAALNEIDRRLSLEVDPASGGEAPGKGEASADRPARAKRDRRFARGHLDDMALAVAATHPGWTNAQVAHSLGCHVKSLSNRDLCPKFIRYRQAQKSGRERFRGGYRDARTGHLGQVADDDT